MGGFGSAVLECVAQHGPVRARIQLMAVPDLQLEHASRKQVLEEVGLDTESVVARFMSSKAATV